MHEEKQYGSMHAQRGEGMDGRRGDDLARMQFFFSGGVMKRRRRIAGFTSKLKMQMLKGVTSK